MKSIKISDSAWKYAEETKGEYQTVSGRLSELISIGAQAEPDLEDDR